jgi:hypothetical protein
VAYSCENLGSIEGKNVLPSEWLPASLEGLTFTELVAWRIKLCGRRLMCHFLKHCCCLSSVVFPQVIANSSGEMMSQELK